MKIKYRMKGGPKMRAELRRLGKLFPKALAAALYQEGLALDALANSKDFIPVDTGRMRATHYVAPPTVRGGVLQVEIGYGVTYAPFVHEITEAHHPVGRSQWLLAAVVERSKGFHRRLAKRTLANAAAGVETIPLGAAPTRPKDG